MFLFSAIFPVFCIDNEQITDSNENIIDNLDILDSQKQKPRLYGFSISPYFGFVYGQSIELLFPVNTKGEYLSELLWDMKPVFYSGLQVEFGVKEPIKRPGVFSMVSFKTGNPGITGYHENFDWQSIENDALTNYSIHTNRTVEFLWLDVFMGASIPISRFYIKPFLSGSWMRFSFSGSDGHYIYARSKDTNTYHPIEDNPYIGNLSGEVIRYQQNWFLAAAGLSFGTNILTPVHLDFSFQISPLTYCAAIDYHILRSIKFFDFTSMGLFIEPKGSISYSLEKLDFLLEFSYRYIERTRGESYSKHDSSIYAFRQTNDSGTGLSIYNTRALMRIKL